MSRRDWPEWWDWELELSPHLFKRMDDRRFTEIDLRRMLERATGYRPDVVEVEPDRERQLLVVVTAYPVWE